MAAKSYYHDIGDGVCVFFNGHEMEIMSYVKDHPVSLVIMSDAMLDELVDWRIRQGLDPESGMRPFLA